jgi:hypothetical protein
VGKPDELQNPLDVIEHCSERNNRRRQQKQRIRRRSQELQEFRSYRGRGMERWSIGVLEYWSVGVLDSGSFPVCTRCKTQTFFDRFGGFSTANSEMHFGWVKYRRDRLTYAKFEVPHRVSAASRFPKPSCHTQNLSLALILHSNTPILHYSTTPPLRHSTARSLHSATPELLNSCNS